jgi:MGT family glycosyltransferase
VSHYLFLPMPGHGHVNPTLAVAARLVARGHRVTYLLPEPFREAVTATGAELVGYHGEQAAAPPVTAGGPPIAALTNLLMDTAERVAEPVLELYDRLRPDLVVHESMSLWGRLVTEARSAKGVHLSPSYPMGHHSPVARRFTPASAAGGPPFDAARLLAVGDRYGVRIDDPAGFLWRPAARTVVFMPVEFHPGGGALGDTVHFVGRRWTARTRPGPPRPDRSPPTASTSRWAPCSTTGGSSSRPAWRRSAAGTGRW